MTAMPPAASTSHAGAPIVSAAIEPIISEEIAQGNTPEEKDNKDTNKKAIVLTPDQLFVLKKKGLLKDTHLVPVDKQYEKVHVTPQSQPIKNTPTCNIAHTPPLNVDVKILLPDFKDVSTIISRMFWAKELTTPLLAQVWVLDENKKVLTVNVACEYKILTHIGLYVLVRFFTKELPEASHFKTLLSYDRLLPHNFTTDSMKDMEITTECFEVVTGLTMCIDSISCFAALCNLCCYKRECC